MGEFYLYTETAFHHQGDINFLKSLIDSSKEAGAQGVKFQVLTNVEDFVSTKHTSFDALSSYCLTYSEWHEVFEYAKRSGMDIIFMPLNIGALDLLSDFKVKYLDIHSVSFNDLELLEALKRSEPKIILGVGGRSIDEIIQLREFFGEKLDILMVGLQSFPSRLEDINLGKITLLKDKFPSLTIGYADHSSYNHEHAVISNEYAYLLGATVFEKHITLREGSGRVDADSAMSAESILKMKNKLSFLRDNITNSYGDPMNQSEETYRNRQLRCVASNDMSVGQIVQNDNVELKLIDVQFDTFTRKSQLVGKRITVQVIKDEAFNKDFVK